MQISVKFVSPNTNVQSYPLQSTTIKLAVEVLIAPHNDSRNTKNAHLTLLIRSLHPDKDTRSHNSQVIRQRISSDANIRRTYTDTIIRTLSHTWHQDPVECTGIPVSRFLTEERLRAVDACVGAVECVGSLRS